MANNEANDEEKASLLANQFQNVFTTESSLRQTYKATLKRHTHRSMLKIQILRVKVPGPGQYFTIFSRNR